MVYLQDADNASRLFALNSSGVRRLPKWRSRLLKRTAARNVSGHLGQIADEPAAIYLAGGQLWFAIDGEPWFLDELTAEVDRADDGCSIRISTPKHSYQFLVDTTPLDADTTSFASLEDLSFGLWAARIVKNRERQNVLLEVLVDAPLDEVPEHAEKNGHKGSVNVRDSWSRPTRPPNHDPSRERSTE